MDNLNEQYENIKRRIFRLISREFIVDEDIINLSNMNFDDIVDFSRKGDFKNKVLADIYFSPFLLCNDKLIEEPFISLDSIANLLVKRFNEEIYEYQLKLNEGEISEMEYNNNQLYLNYLYYTSTFIGRKVCRYYQDKILDTDNKYCNRLLKK